MDFEQYVREHGAHLLRLATLLTDDAATAEDVVQEVLIRAHRRWPRISGLTYPHAYLRRMVVNEVGSWRRRRSRVEVVGDPDPDTLRYDDREERELRAHVLAALTTLPTRQRAAVVLRYFEGLSYAEIAVALACRATSARGYVHRALRTLRVEIDPTHTPIVIGSTKESLR